MSLWGSFPFPVGDSVQNCGGTEALTAVGFGCSRSMALPCDNGQHDQCPWKRESHICTRPLLWPLPVVTASWRFPGVHASTELANAVCWVGTCILAYVGQHVEAGVDVNIRESERSLRGSSSYWRQLLRSCSAVKSVVVHIERISLAVDLRCRRSLHDVDETASEPGAVAATLPRVSPVPRPQSLALLRADAMGERSPL